MRLRRLFFLPLSFFLLIWWLTADQTTEIQKIDSQIQELQEMKRGFEARALRHEDQVEYLQFNDRAVLETRKHLQLADENRAKAAKVQEEIDRLQAKKEKLRA